MDNLIACMSAQGWGYAFEPFELTMAGDALEAEVDPEGLEKRRVG